jgi:hypothetical protein
MKRVSLICLVLLAAGLAHAGKSTFSGTGSASAPAEEVSVRFSVESECYPTAQEAQEANDQIVGHIQEYLETLINRQNGVDQIICNGGNTSTFERTILVDGKPVTVCQNTFKKTTEITLTTKVDGFSQVFATVQDKILANFGNSGSKEAKASSFVEIGKPSGDVCQKTHTKLKCQAFENATKNAHAKFLSFAECCGIDLAKTTIVAGSEPQQHYTSNKSIYRDAAFDAAPMVEVSFEDISYTTTVNVDFDHPDTPFNGCSLMTGCTVKKRKNIR